MAFYPQNCAFIVHVLDFVVNGPMKKIPRDNKADRMHDEFQAYLRRFKLTTED